MGEPNTIMRTYHDEAGTWDDRRWMLPQNLRPAGHAL